MQFVRGQRAKLSQLSNRTKRFNAEIVLQSVQVPVFDFVCFGIDAHGQLSDDRYMVFFNQKQAPGDAVTLEELQDKNAKFTFDLDAVPPEITRLVFTVSVDGTGIMASLNSGLFSLKEEGVSGQQTLLEYKFVGSDFQTESALMLAEIYRKDGEWRVWAQGQGFAGNLSALLAHFGGQEIEDSGASAATSSQASTSGNTAPQSSSRQPSPPVSAPAVISVPVSLPLAPSRAGVLQETIAQTPAGGVVSLTRGEHQGPIYVDKPLTLQGNGAVIWASNGPVIVVQSTGVSLQDIEVEATAPEEGIENSEVALLVAPQGNVQLTNVRTRGRIVGIPEADGEWKIPTYLNFGEIAPRATNSFGIEIDTPRACEVKSTVSGVTIVPKCLEKGRQNLEIRVENISSDTFLTGNIEFLTNGVVRTIPISGHTASQPCNPVKNPLIWSVDAIS